MACAASYTTGKFPLRGELHDGVHIRGRAVQVNNYDWPPPPEWRGVTPASQLRPRRYC